MTQRALICSKYADEQLAYCSLTIYHITKLVILWLSPWLLVYPIRLNLQAKLLSKIILSRQLFYW